MPRQAKAKTSPKNRRGTRDRQPPQTKEGGRSDACPIVGIGGSAGGFEAAVELLRNLPQKPGMSFVIVQHLDPHHESKLAPLLARATSMTVTEITGTTKPKANTVYVQPPNKCVVCKDSLPALLKTKCQDGSIRVWVPGCASGEEVYSVAICILEALGRDAFKIRIQIFGTDLSEFAIEHARAGIYSGTIARDVSPSRLKRFFEKRESMYQIKRYVRDVCTFAQQNITADPPFSRLDLISCRNLLIYLGPELHKRCIPQFHYALRPGGLLVLGPAESVGGFDELFYLEDKKNKIYSKKNVPTPATAYRSFRSGEAPHGPANAAMASQAITGQLLQTADRIILGAYAPAAVIIDSNLHVQQFRGQADTYLEHAPGPATLNLLQLARPSLIPDLRATIRRALKSNKPARRERAVVRLKSKDYRINIQVVPFKIAASEKPWLLVIFDETTRGTKSIVGKSLIKNASQQELTELRRQLTSSEESLQTVIEEQEATNEELKSANEEIESSNEELQSTNEELETAKEELQSTNEELTTLNEELSNRNLEMMRMNSDLNNLLASIQLPIVMVDSELTVRRATPAARNAFNILPTDVGRPIGDLKPNVRVPNLEKLIREVIETLEPRESKTHDSEGRDYSLRIRPYRTADDKIDGAVITVVDMWTPKGRKKKRPMAASRR